MMKNEFNRKTEQYLAMPHIQRLIGTDCGFHCLEDELARHEPIDEIRTGNTVVFVFGYGTFFRMYIVDESTGKTLSGVFQGQYSFNISADEMMGLRKM